MKPRLRSAVETTVQAPARVLVNCAGIGLAAGLSDVKANCRRMCLKTIQVNLIGTYLMMSHTARTMLELDPLTVRMNVGSSSTPRQWHGRTASLVRPLMRRRRAAWRPCVCRQRVNSDSLVCVS